MPHILVIENDLPTASLIIDAFAKLNWQAVHYTDVFKGIKEASRNTYNLIIIGELESPITVSSFCRRVRQQAVQTPILIIDKQYSVDQVVAVLEAGADTYMAKPIAIRELVARTQAMLSRSPRQSMHKIRLADLEIDKHKRIVHKEGNILNLRKREFEILLLLVENRDRVLSRTHINSRTMSGYLDSDDNCIDVHISNLRKALSTVGCNHMIETVHGIGYRLKPGI